ncbi:MAG: hypothetical protein WAV09_00020 [Minisyncoccia bacterium]
MSTVLVSDKFVPVLSRWWILDAKNADRTNEESDEHKELTQTLLTGCSFATEDDLRRVATALVAKRLRKLR